MSLQVLLSPMVDIDQHAMTHIHVLMIPCRTSESAWERINEIFKIKSKCIFVLVHVIK